MNVQGDQNWSADALRSFSLDAYHMGCAVRKCVFGHMGTMKTRLACTTPQSDQDLNLRLTESLDTTVCMNGEQSPR